MTAVHSGKFLLRGLMSLGVLFLVVLGCSGPDSPTNSTVLVESISLSPSTLNLAVDEVSAPLTVTYTPTDTTQQGVTWTSSDTTVATVLNGVVTGRASGNATITATSTANGSITASVSVTVSAIAIPLTGIGLSPSTLNLTVNEVSAPLTVTYTPTNTTQQGVTWASSNPAVATVLNNGVVTGIAPGNATITATSAVNGNITATTDVTVSAAVSTEPPPVPENLEITAGDHQLRLTWTGETAGVLYEIRIANSENLDAATQYGGLVSGIEKVLTGLANRTPYWIWIRARNSVDVSEWAGPVSGTPRGIIPAAPGQLVVEAGDGKLTVGWTAVEKATAYEVWWNNTNNSNDAVQYGDDFTETFAVISDLTNGSSYWVWVKAKNIDGGSSFSAAASGTPVTDTSIIDLTHNTWQDGVLAINESQKYQFYAEAGKSYSINWNDSNDGDHSKTGDIRVSAYWKTGEVDLFTNINSGYTTPQTFTANKSGYIVIKTEAAYAAGYYAVKYKDNSVIELPPSPGYTNLANDVWYDNSINFGADQYYQFYAQAGHTYSINWNDSYNGDGTKSSDVRVYAYWSTNMGTSLFDRDDGFYSTSMIDADRSGYIVLKVNGYYSGGTYAVKYKEEIRTVVSPPITITLSGDKDEDINLDYSYPGNGLSKSNEGYYYLYVSGSYSRYQWILDGNDLMKDQYSSFTNISASNLTVGLHHLTVVIYKGSVPYSKKLSFTVNP
ncbi:hypothetical protein AGMMS50293_25790 [Spirochaetia bacterium]|nr:hypothetical protein AGMMS50293_25790 [Spirochaetia bacterium]